MMGKTFLVNINCSKILPNSEATHYTMFIDSSKMSIVYELVEWIRWMFSLKYCIYLMHDNSVIHELEDIHLLSELKNFEIMPCGKHLCVHKNIYRTLLGNLNLIVSWEDMKVHKYFLDKINQMSQKLTQESTKAHAVVQNLITFNAETDGSKNINNEENKLCLTENQQLEGNLTNHPVVKEMCVIDSCYRSVSGAESSIMSTCFDKKTEKEDTLPQLDDIFSLSNLSRNSGNKCSETKKASNASPNKNNSGIGHAKKKFKIDQGTNKYHTKPKPIKPFSVGEILSIIRKDLDDKNMENTSRSSALTAEERDPETKISAVENSISVQDDVTAVRKRQRTRKRKKSRRQTSEDEGFTSCDLENKRPFFPLKIGRSNYDLKPHHIRFDMDDGDDGDNNDDIMDSECIVAPSENELEINSEEINNTSTSAFLKNESQELVSVFNGYDQDVLQKSVLCSAEKKDAYKMECLVAPDNEIAGGGKVIDAQDDPFDRINQSSSSLEYFLSNNSNGDLNNLLSLREKYKNGVVIQRF